MAKYVKPELMVEDVSIISPISALSVNANEAANFSNVEQDSWDAWVDLFN